MNEINLNCGIYQIRNIVTNVCYTGQSMRLKIRPREHWQELKNNKHKNSHLQNSYNKHGRDNFVFEILIYCAPDDMIHYEQLFYDIDKARGLSYNIRESVDSNKGFHHSDETKKMLSYISKNMSNETRERIRKTSTGRTHSLDTIKKMSGKNNHRYGKSPSKETKAKRLENMPDQNGKNNPFYGKKHTEKSKELMRRNQIDRSGENNPNITKKETVLNIFQHLRNGTNVGIIARKLKIDRHIVSKVKNGFYNEIYNLPDIEWNIIPENTIKKELILKVINMLDNGFTQKNISNKLNICIRTIYRVKKGFYDDIYSLPKRKWDTAPHIVEKSIILQIINMLDKNIPQKDIAFEMGVCLKTVRRVKQGFYNDVYNL